MSSTASSATGAASSTSPAERPGELLRTTRRRLLAGTAGLVAAPSFGAAAIRADDDRGEPFDDGTFFDDGYGWTD
jgi:hypothetical protein